MGKVQGTKKTVVKTLVVWTKVDPGEDQVMAELDLTHPYNVGMLERGEIRPFDAARDDRGPEVKIVATFVQRDSTWHPKTSGIYCLELSREYKGDVRLGMGTRSQPMFKRSELHALYRQTLVRRPELAPYLLCVKTAAIFTADHPDAPGGSRVVIDPATLPAPATGELPKTYMG